MTGKADGSNFTYQAVDTRTSSIISTRPEASKTTANGLAKATDRVIYRITASESNTTSSMRQKGVNDVATGVAAHFNANNNAGISSAAATGEIVVPDRHQLQDRARGSRPNLGSTGSQGDLTNAPSGTEHPSTTTRSSCPFLCATHLNDTVYDYDDRYHLYSLNARPQVSVRRKSRILEVPQNTFNALHPGELDYSAGDTIATIHNKVAVTLRPA